MTSLKPITLTASKALTRNVHGGTVVNLSAAAGLTVTLPASTGKGDKYRIFVATTVTSNAYVIAVANSTDILAGALGLSTDISGTVLLTAATSDTISMNGSTTGGLKGSYVEVTDVASGIWQLSGTLLCTGTEATPFSAAV